METFDTEPFTNELTAVKSFQFQTAGEFEKGMAEYINITFYRLTGLFRKYLNSCEMASKVITAEIVAVQNAGVVLRTMRDRSVQNKQCQTANCAFKQFSCFQILAILKIIRHQTKFCLPYFKLNRKN